jgi:hypothetical protein
MIGLNQKKQKPRRLVVGEDAHFSEMSNMLDIEYPRLAALYWEFLE